MTTNVKPGDLARVVADPDGQGLLGAQILVLEAPTVASMPSGFAALLLMAGQRRHGQLWLCELLEARAVKRYLSGEPSIWPAGEELVIPDSRLKRIDPPADADDLWRDTPIPADHRPMEELADYVKEPKS